MPIIKFDQPENLSDNTGSSRKFVSYLSKEDDRKGLDKEFFFTERNKFVCDYEVIEAIDSNHKGLGNDDAKFYTGSIDFSEDELMHISNSLNGIKEYTILAMEEYARNFNKDLSISDINWFAKIETNRYFKGNDSQVLDGTYKQGDSKPGNNIHVHFIIGRKSKHSGIKLSPITNHQNTTKGPVRGGFSRDVFKENCEMIFDKKFNYNRPYEDSYIHLKIIKKGGLPEKLNLMDQKASVIIDRLKYYQLNGGERIDKLNKLIKYIEYCINWNNPLKLDEEKLLIQESNYSCDGSVYKALMNLNIRMKYGYKPDQKTIMETILKNAEYFHNLNTSYKNGYEYILDEAKMVQSSVDIPKPDLITPFIELSETFIPHARIEDDEYDFLRKRKKKLNRRRGNDLSL